MEQYFIANDIPEDKKVTGFLCAIGVKAYELLHHLVSSHSPKDKWFNDLVKMVCGPEAKITCDCGMILSFTKQHDMKKRLCQSTL